MRFNDEFFRQFYAAFCADRDGIESMTCEETKHVQSERREGARLFARFAIFLLKRREPIRPSESEEGEVIYTIHKI